jgi:RsiW-degrading membrane proteinase PrsW (M82 family)
MMSHVLYVAGIALLSGFVPTVLWLWFWLREDAEHPEPRQLIALAFLAGIAAVTLSVPLEQIVQSWGLATAVQYTLWAYIEEITKFVAALVTVLWRAEDDEPIDGLIYMIIVALGFAAAENTLFLSGTLGGTTLATRIVTGNLRFMGATLLHIVSSACIGLALSFAFYGSTARKISAVGAGVILGGALHAAFNVRILKGQSVSIMGTFVMLWAAVIVLFALIEWVKRIKPQRFPDQTN